MVSYLKRYYQDELKPHGRSYLLPLLFIVLLTSLEYTLGIKDRLFDPALDFWIRWVRKWLFALLVWGLPLYWLTLKRGIVVPWKAILPWVLAVMAAYAFRSTYRGHLDWMVAESVQWDTNTFYFYWYTLAQWFQALSILLALLGIAFLSRKHLTSFHGLKKADMRPYLWLLLGAALMVGLAATQSDFQAYYPRFAKMWPEGGPRQIERIVFFEVGYALDFYATEYLFRGFLVLAFVRYLGPELILPMAIFYVSIHFGKPLGETISSFFGGMLLGIMAHYSRSIWGGIVLHIGLAGLMELLFLF